MGGARLTRTEWLAQRRACTAEGPGDPKNPTTWYHPDAVFVRTCHEGCCSRYQCPHCGFAWWVEYE